MVQLYKFYITSFDKHQLYFIHEINKQVQGSGFYKTSAEGKFTFLIVPGCTTG